MKKLEIVTAIFIFLFIGVLVWSLTTIANTDFDDITKDVTKVILEIKDDVEETIEEHELEKDGS